MLIAGSELARLKEDEALRLAKIKDSARIPSECGIGIAPAPARGAFVLIAQSRMSYDGTDAQGRDKWSQSPTGYGHRAAIRQADVFDRMVASAIRARRPWPLTPGQIQQGRHYRALVEMLEAGGMKMSSLDGRTGGGSGRDFMDVHLDVSRQVEGMRRRIGAGAAMAVRRIRPSDRGSRSTIFDRSLVDMVCLGNRSISDVLRAHGWSTKGDTRKVALDALSGALDRMIGYRG